MMDVNISNLKNNSLSPPLPEKNLIKKGALCINRQLIGQTKTGL